MCGVFGYIGKNNSILECLNGLKLLEYRGYDSSGIASIKNGKIIHFKSPGKVSFLEEKINIKDLDLNLSIGHIRWATHGVVNETNAHPHFDENVNLALVHNGIIENYSQLKKTLISKNIKFQSDTDSEVVAKLVSYHYKKNILDAFSKAINELSGQYAILLIHKDHPTEMIACAKETPLAIGFDDKNDEILVASDPNAFIGKNLNVIFLKNSQIAYIKDKKINLFDKNLKSINIKPEKIILKNISYSKDGYEHYMLKEIFEQPLTIQKAYLGRIMPINGSIDFEDFNLKKNHLKNVKKIIIAACGTSYHAGLIAQYYLQKYLNIDISVEIASEMRFKDLNYSKNTLIIAISQSGETADTISAIREAKKKSSYILAILNRQNSTLALEADATIFLKAGPEMSVCSTKAFTSQITVLYLLSLYIAKIKKIEKSQLIKLLKSLKKVPKLIEDILKQDKIIMQKAKKYSVFSNFFYLGRHLMYPTAMEAALKLKEISYLHASAYPAGEMKHGPLALIDNNLPIIAFVANDKTYDKMLSNLMEAKARGALILAIAFKKCKSIEDVVDDVIWIDNISDELAIFPSSVIGQLFAYYIAKIKNTDIDRPRNLAKSLSVE